MPRIAAIAAASLTLAALAAGTFFALRPGADDPYAKCRTAKVMGTAAIGVPFTLTSSTGARVTDKDVITKPTLVYFGYAFCPDVCPTDLARNATAADILAERGIDVGQVFITTDPARDTPAVLGDYAPMIHPGLVGLTGTPEEIAEVASAYKVFYRKSGDDPETYLMDHSTFTYLMGPGNQFLEFYPSSASAETLADSVTCFSEAA